MTTIELIFVLGVVVAVLGCIQTIQPAAPTPADTTTPGPADGAVSVGLVSTSGWTSDVDPWSPLQPSSEENPPDLDLAPAYAVDAIAPIDTVTYDPAPIVMSPVVVVPPADADPSIPLPTEESDPTLFRADAVDALYPLPTPATDPDVFPDSPTDLPDADPPCPFENWINP